MTPPPGGVRFEHGGTPIYVYPDGRVWSVNNARFNRMGTHDGGYKIFTLGRLSGDPGAFYLHDLVLTLFGPPRPPGMVARHKDGDPSHNSIDNLEWGTQKENIEDQYAHGTAALLAGTFNRAKLKPLDVAAILQAYKLTASDDATFKRQMAVKYDVIEKTIENVIRGRTWKRLKEAA